jgi:hypothetical protein
VTDASSGVVAVYGGFATLKSDGRVDYWGGSSSLPPSLTDPGSNVVTIYSAPYLIALKTTATTFDLSMSYYTDIDRYDILRNKNNRRRVNLTTLNNNVFTLSAARDIQSFNPTMPTDKVLRIIVPDYVSSSYSITSTASFSSDSSNVIIACDEGEPVTISGVTYVNYGSYVYKLETNNTYTKLTTAKIGINAYNVYGGDGINSSGIALVMTILNPTYGTFTPPAKTILPPPLQYHRISVEVTWRVQKQARLQLRAKHRLMAYLLRQKRRYLIQQPFQWCRMHQPPIAAVFIPIRVPRLASQPLVQMERLLPSSAQVPPLLRYHRISAEITRQAQRLAY